jgi:molybdate transport system substrate-binding protein
VPADRDSWSHDWTVGIRVWVERAGHAVLGKGRLELLEAIDRWHSISAAARQMEMSYRRAWLLVQSANESAGVPLVVAEAGGSHGGGARLTPFGQRAVAIFRDLQSHLCQTAGALWPRLAQGPEEECVHVAAAVSLEEVLGQLLADYAVQQPAVTLRTVFGASDALAEHIVAGAPADLFLSADAGPLDQLESAGLVAPASRSILAENRLSAVGPADKAPAVRRPADLLGAGVARVALARPDAPLGRYTRAYLERLGLYEALRPRALWVDNSRAVLAALRASQADVGLVYASDARAPSGCRVLFRARRGEARVRYTVVVLSRGQRAEQARAFLAFLTSPHAGARFLRCGFLSPHSSAAGRIRSS